MTNSALVCQSFGCGSYLVVSPRTTVAGLVAFGRHAGWDLMRSFPVDPVTAVAPAARLWGRCVRCQTFGGRIGAAVDAPASQPARR